MVKVSVHPSSTAMARSYKQTPMTGNTTASTEKGAKRDANRRIRKRVNDILSQVRGRESVPDILPDRRALSNPWDMPKDGKTRFDPEEHPELMRK